MTADAYRRCHVMERESFESQAVAKVLNENFVSIKASGVGVKTALQRQHTASLLGVTPTDRT